LLSYEPVRDSRRYAWSLRAASRRSDVLAMSYRRNTLSVLWPVMLMDGMIVFVSRWRASVRSRGCAALETSWRVHAEERAHQ
jgi:hypothetical protein